SEFFPSPYSGLILRSDLGLVSPSYRQSGLWKLMLEMALEYAYNEFGCRYSIALPTSFKSQTYFQAAGWTTLRWINYDDYFVMGQKVFDMKHDRQHKCAKLV